MCLCALPCPDHDRRGPATAASAGGDDVSELDAVVYRPFHAYGIADAVRHHHVLDVLQDYTTVAIHLQVSDAAPGKAGSAAGKAGDAAVVDATNVQHVMEAAAGHRQVVRRKAEYIAEHFVQQLCATAQGPALQNNGLLAVAPARETEREGRFCVLGRLGNRTGPEVAEGITPQEQSRREGPRGPQRSSADSGWGVSVALSVCLTASEVCCRYVAGTGRRDAKGMLVTRSRKHVAQYALELRQLLSSDPIKARLRAAGICSVGVYGAFSGAVSLSDEDAAEEAPEVRR